TIINDTYQTMLKGKNGNANVIIAKDNDETDPFYKGTEINTVSLTIDSRVDLIQATGKSLLGNERKKVHLTGASFKNAKDMGLVKPLQTTKHFTLSKKEAIISQKTASDYN